MKYFFEQNKREYRFWQSQKLTFPAHIHSGVEFGYVIKGKSKFYFNEKEFELKEGDMYISFPNQIHSFENSEGEFFVGIVPPDITEETEYIFANFLPKIPYTALENEEKEIMFFLFTDLFNEKAKKSLLSALFLQVFEKLELVKQEKFNLSTIQDILIFIEEHYKEQITVKDTAKELNLSVSHISHIFKNKLNSSFTRYITEKRIAYAKKLLRKGNLTITEIAFASGFSSLRTFNRQFLNNEKITPKEYKKIT